MLNRTATALLAGAALALACAAPDAAAQTLYKLIDKNGKVTYAEKPPKDFDGKVIRMDIDPNANTANLPRYTPPATAKAAPGSDGVAAARARLDGARKALADARDNPGEGDVTFIGNKAGGTRPVQSETYARRIAGLEQAVKDAEEGLRKAEQNR